MSEGAGRASWAAMQYNIRRGENYGTADGDGATSDWRCCKERRWDAETGDEMDFSRALWSFGHRMTLASAVSAVRELHSAQ